MKLALFYHIANMVDTDQIVDQQIDRLKKSGLLDKLDYIHVTCLGDTIKSNELLDKADSVLTYKHLDVFETPTTNRIRLFSQENEDFKVLYLYNKGVSYQQGELRDKMISWSNLMEHFLIDHHERCIELLDNYDIVGVLKSPYYLPHYMGNFWWGSTNYLKTLPFLTPETSIRNNPLRGGELKYQILRHDPELWLFRGNPKWVSLFDKVGLAIVKDFFPEEYYKNQIVLRDS